MKKNWTKIYYAVVEVILGLSAVGAIILGTDKNRAWDEKTYWVALSFLTFFVFTKVIDYYVNWEARRKQVSKMNEEKQ